MRMFHVSEGGYVDHHVIAADTADAIALAREHSPDDEPDTEWEAEEVPSTRPMTILLDEHRITHTAAEWEAIYNHQRQYVCCSEF